MERYGGQEDIDQRDLPGPSGTGKDGADQLQDKEMRGKPREEWVRVENTHEAIVSSDDFAIVQNLLKADGRISPARKELSPLWGCSSAGIAESRW